MWISWLIACGGDPVALRDVAPHVRRLLSEPPIGYAAADASALAATADGWRWIEATGEALDWPAPAPRLLGMGQLGGDRLAVGEGLYALRDDGVLTLELPVVPDALCAHGDRAWLSTADGLYAWLPPDLLELRVDGDPLPGPIACGGELYDEPVVWVADGDRVLALANHQTGAEVFEAHRFDAPVDAVAVSASDVAWAVAGGALWAHRGDGWREVEPPEGSRGTLAAVLGGPDAEGVWVIGAEGPLWLGDDGFERPDGLGEPLGRWQTDGLGRLLTSDADGLQRVSVDRPLWLDGARDGDVVTDVTAVRLVPTAPEEVTEARLFLFGADGETELALDDGVATIDPAARPPGLYTVRGTAHYPDRSSTVQRTIELVALGAVTWDEHVRPLHEARCAVCHTGSTETLLDGPTAWQATIGPILDNVRSGAMPIGGPALSPGEVRLVEAWRDNDFP